MDTLQHASNSPHDSLSLLVVGPSWIGDMIMAQSFFKVLKHQHPNADIDVLAPAWTRPLLERMPEVRHAHAMPIGHGQLMLGKRREVAKSLKPYQYDHAFLLPNSLKSALIPWLANIPKRTGWKGEMRYGLLNDIRTLDKEKYPQMIERFCALAFPKTDSLPEVLPYPQFSIDDAQAQQALTVLGLNRDKPIMVLCPGAEYGPAKRWPAVKYRELASRYIAKGWQVWVMGSNNDEEHANIICDQQEGCSNLAGKTQLGQAIDLMSFADVVVSNDSGLMHMAAALSRKLVVVYGSSSPLFTPPLNDDKNVSIVSLSLDCSPCFKRECPLSHTKCLNDLTVNALEAAVDKLTQQ